MFGSLSMLMSDIDLTQQVADKIYFCTFFTHISKKFFAREILMAIKA